MTPASLNSAHSSQRLAAGIVVFEPEGTVLRELIAAISPNVGIVMLFINRLTDAGLRAGLKSIDRVAFIDASENFGIGEALNLIALHAALSGYDRVILFDQDSRPDGRLVAGLMQAFDTLIAQGERPAVVGPTLVAPASGGFKAPRYFRRRGRQAVGSLVPVQFLPTSGSLISVPTFRSVGPFRGDYFIDAIDLEWCFRAWARDYSCWHARDILMVHTVGEGALRLRLLGVRTPKQRDFRFETYIRNTVYGFRLPHIQLSWKLRQGGYLILQVLTAAVTTRFNPALLKRFARGVLNGARGRLGPPDGAL